ncbi:helix-turn-helix domain-containing protein [Streptomyces sioyaensis]|uniref:helix-turn-helix domain-containing protein n=1 Tax=Streptomyces sioyaensis TaxID=67364 RepID=UPI00378F3F66
MPQPSAEFGEELRKRRLDAGLSLTALSAAVHYSKAQLSKVERGMGFTDGDARRTMLAKQIADIIKTQDRHETAEELLSRFDPPASYAPDNDASDETPGL